MFELTDKPIVIHALRSSDGRAGGWVSFEGKVRSVNDGRQVTRLEYEVYAPLALTEGNKILAEARSRFGLLDVYGVHRFGSLGIGETAIWVYASAMHRREAFEGSEYIIHAIKHQLPIWKKESYAEGTSQWVGCSHGELAS